MSIIVQKSDIITALNSIKGTVGQNSINSNSYSSHVLIKCDQANQVLWLTTSEDSSSNSVKIPCINNFAPSADGFIHFPLVDYRLFHRFITSMVSGDIELDYYSEIEDHHSVDKFYIKDSTMKKNIELSAFPHEMMNLIKVDPSIMVGNLIMPIVDFQLNVNTLAPMIKQADGSSITNCISFKVSNDELCCESYNDKTVNLSLLQTVMTAHSGSPTLQFFMDYFKFKSVLPHLDKTKDITIEVYPDFVRLLTDDYISIIRFMSGSFPNIQSIIPAQYCSNTFVLKTDLLKALNRIMLIYNSNEHLNINVTSGALIIQCQSYLGSIDETVTCATTGSVDFTLKVNPKNLIEVLVAYPFEHIMLLYPVGKALVVGTAIAKPNFNYKVLVPAAYDTTNVSTNGDAFVSFGDEAALSLSSSQLHPELIGIAVEQDDVVPNSSLDFVVNPDELEAFISE